MTDSAHPRDARLGRLRDKVETWVGGLDSVVEVHAMIETAFLMAVADGSVSVPEYEQLVATIEFATHKHLGPGRVRSMLNQYTDALRADGWRTRIAQVTQCIPGAASRRVAYRLAAGVSFVDGWVHEHEARLFGLLAEAFEIPIDEAERILSAARDALFGDEDLTQPVIRLERRRQKSAS